MENFNSAIRRADNEALAKSINQELMGSRPKWGDFVGKKGYTRESMERDSHEIEEYFSRKGVDRAERKKALTDGILVEKFFKDLPDSDLLDEGKVQRELVDEDNEDGEEVYLLEVDPAHVYDDTFNNVDMICAVCNKFTKNQPVVFAVDCTSDDSKVREKMGYRRTDEKIRGFTEIKYFRGMGPVELGRQPKVPRFVAGFNAELIREAVQNQYDEGQSPWVQEAYQTSKQQAAYYILQELVAQSKGSDTGLGEYFSFLLEHFKKSHPECESYPGDPVARRVLENVAEQKITSAAA